MNFAQRLKQLRKQSNLTQEEFATKISKTRSTIAGYETERKEPDYETLKAIADFFNVSIDYLLGRTDIKNPYKEESGESETIAARHDEDEFTEEELQSIEQFKEFVRMKRKKQK